MLSQSGHNECTKKELFTGIVNLVKGSTTGEQNTKEQTQTRIPLLAEYKHKVNFRDEGRCTHAHKNGQRCNQKRWLEIHHLTPVKSGGILQINLA